MQSTAPHGSLPWVLPLGKTFPRISAGCEASKASPNRQKFPFLLNQRSVRRHFFDTLARSSYAPGQTVKKLYPGRYRWVEPSDCNPRHRKDRCRGLYLIRNSIVNVLTGWPFCVSALPHSLGAGFGCASFFRLGGAIKNSHPLFVFTHSFSMGFPLSNERGRRCRLPHALKY